MVTYSQYFHIDCKIVSGVITAADNIKYPAINAFVRAFQQDQGQNISSGDTWNDISSQNHFSGEISTR